jgi:hypothetical protein
MKKLFLLFFIIFITQYANAQSGIFFQAIARDNTSNPAKDREIFVLTNIIQSTPTGTIVLTEEHKTSTDAYGIFNIIVGGGRRVGGTVTGLSTIDWSNGPYYLNIKIVITPITASNTWDYTKEWIDIGTTIFGTVPFALYSASTAKIDEKLNTSDTSKMLEPYAKGKVVQILSTTIDTKLSTSDTASMLAPYAKLSYSLDSIYLKKQIASLLGASDTIKFTKQTYTDSALLTKLTTTGSAASLTNFPILNQNTTGNAATAIYAGNITATSNTTLTSLSNLNTVGIITAGVWSATAIDVAHGGTGLTTPGLPGQALTTTTTGTLTWTNVSILTGAHFIGESYGGGIVFYVYDNGKHGLIVSAEDQSTGGVNWYNGTYSTTNAVRDGINAGLMNTERIIISQGAGNYAAQIAANYKAGGYGDWYLPSAYELGLLHLQRELFFTGANVIFYYFSSNEHPSNNRQVMCYRFTPTSYNSYLDKLNNQVRIRAIRAF